MTKRFVELALCAALAVGMGTAALAQGGAAEAVAKRQAGMKTLFQGARAVTTAATGGDFDTAGTKAKELAATVHGFAGLFPAGSAVGAGLNTKAKPEIWSDSAGFKAALDKSAAAADAVVASVASKDAAAVGAAVAAFQGTCGGCHTPYRAAAAG